MSAPPSSYTCPRCKTIVAAGSSYCLACAARAQVAEQAPIAQGGSFPRGLCLVLGLVALMLVALMALGAIGIAARAKQLASTRGRRSQRPALPVPQPQGQTAPQAPEIPATENLAFLEARLQDLERNEVSPQRTVQRGGVIIAYRAGCKDCTAKLPQAEKLVTQARKAGLGAHVIICNGDWGAVDQDKVPEGIRDCVLLDARGSVLAGLGARDMTVLVFDRAGDLAYKGLPEEAPSMLATVANAEGE